MMIRMRVTGARYSARVPWTSMPCRRGARLVAGDDSIRRFGDETPPAPPLLAVRLEGPSSSIGESAEP